MSFLRFVLGFEADYVESMVRSGRMITPISTTAMLAAFLAMLTLLAMLVALFVGPQRFRSMRAWLLFMTLSCGWLGFAMSWPEVYWRGQQRRMKTVHASVESMAQYLQSHWPREDGNLHGIGPFLAYPKGDPTTILLLNWITFPETKLRFSAVERTKNGTIRFELSGNETGAWLEWRPDDKVPEAFHSGLETNYSVARQQRLAPRWYLVRYRASADTSTL